jgi:hypothetical protein
MKYAHALLPAATMIAATISWSGCSSSPGIPGPTQPFTASLRAGHEAPSPNAKSKDLLYVSEFNNGYGTTVNIYDATDYSNPAPVGQIIDGISGPVGLAIDRQGTLYVANYGSQSVQEYKQGETSPFLTVRKGLRTPELVAVSEQGELAVANLPLRSRSSIAFFDAGQRTPSRVVRCFIKGAYPAGVTYTRSGDLYVALQLNQQASRIIRIPHGTTTCMDTGIVSPVVIGQIAFDLHKTLWVSDFGNRVILEYPAGQILPAPFEYGAPYFSQGVSFFAFDHSFNMFAGQSGQVLAYPYFSNQALAVWSQGMSQATGIALWPPPRL